MSSFDNDDGIWNHHRAQTCAVQGMYGVTVATNQLISRLPDQQAWRCRAHSVKAVGNSHVSSWLYVIHRVVGVLSIANQKKQVDGPAH